MVMRILDEDRSERFVPTIIRWGKVLPRGAVVVCHICFAKHGKRQFSTDDWPGVWEMYSSLVGYVYSCDDQNADLGYGRIMYNKQ